MKLQGQGRETVIRADGMRWGVSMMKMGRGIELFGYGNFGYPTRPVAEPLNPYPYPIPAQP